MIAKTGDGSLSSYKNFDIINCYDEKTGNRPQPSPRKL